MFKDCDYCGKKFKLSYKKHRYRENTVKNDQTHTNIEQNPQIHYFCNRCCKEKWVWQTSSS